MMLFKDMRAGYQVYSLDKKTMKAAQAKVVNVGAPYAEAPKVGQMAPSLQRFVDVTLETDGKTQTYSIPETASVTYAGDLVLSTEVEGIIREVQAIKAQSEEVIKSYDSHVDKVKLCDTVMEELDTSYKEKRAFEGRLSKVETFMEEMRNDVKNLLKSLG